MKNKFVKIVVFVPETHSEIIRTALHLAGAGQIGNYDNCTFASKGIGRFRPPTGSNPFLGSQNQIEEVNEEKIETICPFNIYLQVIKAVKAAHPYEEPAIDIIPLLNE